MPRISPAAAAASSGVVARLMPPALPRLPVGTCALTTQAPMRRAIASAASALAATAPGGVAIPAAASRGLAACSSKFIAPYFPYLAQ